MQSVLLAESAILVHFKPVGIVFLVLHRVVVALLAFRASQCDFNPHDGTSILTENNILPLRTAALHYIYGFNTNKAVCTCQPPTVGKGSKICNKKRPSHRGKNILP